MHNYNPMSYPMHPKEWEYLEKQKAELSSTWKERHAKGVPVAMDESEWMDKAGEVLKSVVDTLPFYGYHRHPIHGSITITTDYLRGKVAGRFCDFRYKPEWLENKGQTNN